MDSKKLCLLHIEDDQVDRLVVERFLKKMSIVSVIHHAANGAEALDKLKGTNGQTKLEPMPNIVLADINMPMINGIEFLIEMRKDPDLSHMVVYMITTSSDAEDISNAYKQHVAGYIIKPIELSDFENTFKTIEDFWKICVFPK